MSMSEESHFEVRRAREMLERWRERAARQQAKKTKEHRPTFDEEQYQKDIGYLLLVMGNLETGYYARFAATESTRKRTQEEAEAARTQSGFAAACEDRRIDEATATTQAAREKGRLS